MNQLVDKWIFRGVPAVVGIGVAWVVVKIVKNEARLLLRQSELQDKLATNSWKEKTRLFATKNKSE